MTSPLFREMCENTRVTNMTFEDQSTECDFMADLFHNISHSIDGMGPQSTILSSSPATNLTYNDTYDALSEGRHHRINSTKLVVLTVIICFTVVGNFGVVLAILMRR